MKPTELAFVENALDPPPGRPPIHVKWLGTAGFSIEHDGCTILIDPYVTRASLFDCIRHPLRSDPLAVRRHVPVADAIIAGHTHFDHVLDVPGIARDTGATVYGSRSCTTLCQTSGVPTAQVVDVEAHRGVEPFRADVGPFELRFIPSVHSAFLFGRIPSAGNISDCDQIPLRTTGYRCGAVFGVDIRVAGRRIYHLGSADLLDGHPDRDVDLLLMCVAGWTTTERFCPRVMGSLRPGAILLSHWDDFFRPLTEPARALPAMRMGRLVDGLTAVDPSVQIGTLPILGSLAL
ncbi:MAG: MBL fold metallo-hydrolase [Deltaproteobacteria bacterium]|nr:MBL fold metallo-hydrolase [Deltaproteobacteria bacterium]